MRSDDSGFPNCLIEFTGPLGPGQATLTPDALQRQTRIFQAILRDMGAGVVVADSRGKFLLFNPTAERILGIGPVEVPGSHWPQAFGLYLPDQVTLYPPDQLPLARAIRGEVVDEVEMFIRNEMRPEGLWLTVTGRPLHDEADNLYGGLVVFRDVTQKKRAEARLAAQHAVTQVLAESGTLSEATPKVIQAICESVGWELGVLWNVDVQQGVLRCVDV